MTGEQEPRAHFPPAGDNTVIDLTGADSVVLPGGEAAPPLTGREYLDAFCEHEPERQAINYAFAMAVALRHTQAALSTGRDVSLLGVPSQQLLCDILQAVGTSEDTMPQLSGGEILFDELNLPLGRALQPIVILRGDMAILASEIESLMGMEESDATLGDRYVRRVNLIPMAEQIRILSEKYINRHLDTRPLAHEGGSLSDYEPGLFMDFADRDYLKLLFDDPDLAYRSGLTGQVRKRLLYDMDLLYAIAEFQAQEASQVTPPEGLDKPATQAYSDI